MGADPVSWGLMGMMAAQTVAGGISQSRQAGAQAKAARRQSEYAMSMAQQEAQMHERQAELDKKLAHAGMRRQMSASRVGSVGSGIDSGSGSALEILSGAAANNALTLSRIGYEGKLKSAQARNRGLETAYGYTYATNAAKARSSDALLQTGLSLGTSILGMGAKG